MRCSRILALVLSIPVLLWAGDLFTSLGLDPKEFEESCFQFVKEPERLPYLHITPAMRALAVLQRKSAAEAIGARAKAYFASEAFKKRWAEYRAQSTGGEEQEALTAKYAAEGAQQMEMAIQQMEQMLPMMPPAQQAEMKKAIAQAKAQKAEQGAGETASGAPPKDPAVQLKKALRHFLKVTDGVDYAAAMTQRDGRRFFARPEYEAKPREWKMAFRAGREATEGARAYVQGWLAGLK